MSQLKNLRHHHLLSPFQLFKYFVYLLLARNIWLFYLEESAASAVMKPDGYPWIEFINVYVASIDTSFWVLLLLLFELETWVIPDDKITAPVKVAFTALRSVCYASIVYALYGYCITYFELSDWQRITASGADLCARIGQDFMYSLERFTTISAENCGSLATSSELLTNKNLMVTDENHFRTSWMLAIADVINAADWLLIVVILEVEIWLQTLRRLTPGVLSAVKLVNIVLYSVLGIVAVFWGFYGEFIDFWDAFLWIVAFIFIENNVIQWNKESQKDPVPAA